MNINTQEKLSNELMGLSVEIEQLDLTEEDIEIRLCKLETALTDLFLAIHATGLEQIHEEISFNLAQKQIERVNLPKGILNLGSSCYMNSVMQALINNDFFKEKLMKADFVPLQNFMHGLESSTDPEMMIAEAMELREEIFKTGLFRDDPIDRQEDAAELMEYILGLTDYQIPLITHRSVPEYQGSSQEVTSVLQIPILKQEGPLLMQQLIDDVFKRTLQENWGDFPIYVERLSLGENPLDKLVIQFKRFTPAGKIQDDILPPEDYILDFSEAFGQQAFYRITGAIHHGGEAGGGHYRAVTEKLGRWYDVNDSVISKPGNLYNQLSQSYIFILERIA